jgi:hypothetical protein
MEPDGRQICTRCGYVFDKGMRADTGPRLVMGEHGPERYAPFGWAAGSLVTVQGAFPVFTCAYDSAEPWDAEAVECVRITA